MHQVHDFFDLTPQPRSRASESRFVNLQLSEGYATGTPEKALIQWYQPHTHTRSHP